MLLMVGLGNPGAEYAGHRHNIGFMAVDAIAEADGFSPWRSKFSSRISEGQLGGVKVLLQKPDTFMNRSGQAVAQAANFHKLALDDLLILHDELDLAPGKLKIKEGGGVAGHNGLRSIAQSIGTRDFKRVRFGIGHPGDKARVTGHVLGNFSKADRDWLDPLLDAFVSAAPFLAGGDDAGCMNKIAVLTKPNEHKPDPAKAAGNGTGRSDMGFNCGIVGLPNVGKSTLFNALTSTAAAAAANYPFCTIEPNTGRVPVPDERLDVIARIAKSAKIIETQLEVIDIAGLVRGASKGEGLGNQFLGAIRGVDAILHVLRCFDDDDVTHVEGGVDPARDAELINTELLLADLASLEKRSEGLVKRARGGDKEAKAQLALIERIRPAMEDGQATRNLEAAKDDADGLKALDLITAKPILYVCNVEEDAAADGNDHARSVAAFAEKEGAGAVVVSAAIEAELSQLDADDRADYLATLGLERPGLDRVIQAGYRLLGLKTFLTAGPKESRAWTIVDGMTAAEAAGRIHTDFQRGFICAETIAYDDYIACNGEAGAREAGKLRQEGRDYIVKDGDVILFRFNV